MARASNNNNNNNNNNNDNNDSDSNNNNNKSNSDTVYFRYNMGIDYKDTLRYKISKNSDVLLIQVLLRNTSIIDKILSSRPNVIIDRFANIL